MKRTLLILAALTLAGCANLKFQASASYMTDNLAADMVAAREARAPAPVLAKTETLKTAKP